MNLDRLANALRDEEGLRLRPYRCPNGYLTIGIGRNLDTKGISREEAWHLLYNDIEECTSQLNEHIPWWKTLDDQRREVLVQMCFQLGIMGLLRFMNFIDYLKQGDYDKAADEMLNSKWAKQDSPERAQRLADIMRKA